MEPFESIEDINNLCAFWLTLCPSGRNLSETSSLMENVPYKNRNNIHIFGCELKLLLNGMILAIFFCALRFGHLLVCRSRDLRLATYDNLALRT